jgi:hypothetical protein
MDLQVNTLGEAQPSHTAGDGKGQGTRSPSVVLCMLFISSQAGLTEISNAGSFRTSTEQFKDPLARLLRAI